MRRHRRSDKSWAREADRRLLLQLVTAGPLLLAALAALVAALLEWAGLIRLAG